MTSRLPWATAAILIVAAVAVGTWAVFSVPPVEEGEQPPAPGPASWSQFPGVMGAPDLDNSGIENIYIVKSGQDYTENFKGLGTDNVWGVITSSGATFATMTYNQDFAIVVAVTGHTDNIGKTTLAYLKVALGAYTDSGVWSISCENSDDDSEVDEYSRGTLSDRIFANVVWDNNNNYYQLEADDNLEIENVNLWLRG